MNNRKAIVLNDTSVKTIGRTQTLEAKVTGKGIRLLGGGITDEMVDLDG